MTSQPVLWQSLLRGGDSLGATTGNTRLQPPWECMLPCTTLGRWPAAAQLGSWQGAAGLVMCTLYIWAASRPLTHGLTRAACLQLGGCSALLLGAGASSLLSRPSAGSRARMVFLKGDGSGQVTPSAVGAAWQSVAPAPAPGLRCSAARGEHRQAQFTAQNKPAVVRGQR